MIFKRSSLRYAVLLALLIGLLIPMALLQLYDAQVSRRRVIEDLRRDLARSTEVMSLSLAEPVWQVSPDLAEPMVRAQMEDPRFVAVQVIEPSMPEPFLSFQRPLSKDDDLFQHDASLTVSETRPVLHSGREIAKLTVSMSAAPLLAANYDDMWRNFWRSLATMALSSVLILWVMQRRVLQPMGRLTRAAEALAANQLDRPIALGGTDEIARVGQAMEHMRKALLAAFGALRKHANTLEEQVTQRTAELTATNADLSLALAHLGTAQKELVESEKLASLGRLVAGVAHELNTPLGNSLTVVSTLEDRYKQLAQMLNERTPMRRSALETLVRDTRRSQDILQRNVQKAADLVRDFKQVAIDQTTDLRRSFDLAAVLKDVVELVEPSFNRTPHKIEVDVSPGLLMDSYPGSLGQVLTNLLMNALIHGFEGQAAGQVRVHGARVSADMVSLSVSDNGCGMDESVRRRIFEPFFTTKLGTGGSGLGMHIVHNLVTHVLGGQIEVRSSTGRGTQMLIHLPCIAPTREVREGDAGLRPS
jgi:signal transduction histidine kinase